MTSSSDNDITRRRLFVHGVSPKCANAALSAFFASYGTVTAVHNSKHGYAFVTFEEEDEAVKALGANGEAFQGKGLSVRTASVVSQRLLNPFRSRGFIGPLFDCT